MHHSALKAAQLAVSLWQVPSQPLAPTPPGALCTASSSKPAAAKPFPSPWCKNSLSQERWAWGGHGSTLPGAGTGHPRPLDSSWCSCTSPKVGWEQGTVMSPWSGLSSRSPSLSGWVKTVTHARKINYLLVISASTDPTTSGFLVTSFHLQDAGHGWRHHLIFCSGAGETAPPECHRSSHLLVYSLP